MVDCRRIIDKAKGAVHSSKGRDLLLYLMFVCVAFVFWFFLSLDSELQRDYDVPVEIENVPDSVTMLGIVPSEINVSVHGKGYQLIRFMWGKMPVMRVKFIEHITDGNVFALPRPKLESRLRDYFGQGVQIMSMRPDSLRLRYTTVPGVTVRLDVDADIRTDLQYVLSGPIMANVDSVRVFAPNGLPSTVTAVTTEPLIKSGLRDTSRFEVAVRPMDGMRIIPDRVIVTVPVEPLIVKKKKVKIEVTGIPEGAGLITFPSVAEVSYLVPMSFYNDDYPVSAFVDFNSIDNRRQRAKLHLTPMPELYRNVMVEPDSVEYIIEKNARQ